MHFWLKVTITTFLVSAACVFSHSSSAIALDARKPTPSRVEKSESLPDLPLGQLLIIGFKGTRLNEGLADIIKETKPGGILLFGRNVKSAEQVAHLTFSAQNLSKKVSKSPLLIAIDQEGGNVIRIRHVPTLPSALAISKTRDLTIARRAGLATGRLLKSLGINMNLAPVVDVSDPDTDKFLGTRSFGNDPYHVAAMTTQIAIGLQAKGILPIAKHFPGHGDTSGDSHLVAATSPSDRDELFRRDLIPYFSFAKHLKKPWGAMLAHVSFPQIDSSGTPATFSKPIVSGIFRGEISESALVMTDDIEMAGAGIEKNVGQRAVRAIEAGADMVMIAWSRKIQKEVTVALREAVESGRLKRSRIEEALQRISRAKATYVPVDLKQASNEELARSLRNPDFRMLGNAVLRAARRNLEERRTPASVVAGDPRFDAISAAPVRLKRSVDPIIVLSTRRDFLAAFKANAAGFEIKTTALRPSRREKIERLLRANPESAVFVYVSGRQVANFISSFDDTITRRMILVNVETRAMLAQPERFRDIFDVHYRHPNLGAIVAQSYLELPVNPRRTAASQSPGQKP